MDAESMKYLAEGLKYLGVGLTALALMGAAMGVGRIFGSLLEAISRNPEARGYLMTPSFIGAAFAEFMGLLAFVIAMVLIFVV